MHQLLAAQYEGIKGARQSLFAYCRTINNVDLLTKSETFNNNSILMLLTHVANSYLHWIKFFDLQIPPQYFNEEAASNMKDIEHMFEQVDSAITGFFARHKTDYEERFTKTHPRKNQLITTTPLLLFTHVITHEFHHKGQILTMSRLLGYTPVDTDVIRT
ncbi:MAG: DinB family protein [Mucilaginibacter sp.]